MRTTIAVIIVIGLLTHNINADEHRISNSVQQGLKFLDGTGTPFAKNTSCITCHHSPFMTWAQSEADRSGFAVDGKTIEKTTDDTLARLIKQKENYKSQQWSHTLSMFYVMSQPGKERLTKRQKTLDQLGQIIVENQQENGSWRAASQFTGQRRPNNEAHRVQTLWGILALSRLEPHNPTFTQNRERALKWLHESEPGQSIDARVLQSIVEHRWGKPEDGQSLMTNLVETQNDDGGWGWQAGDPSDAWATGMVLFASSVMGDTKLSAKITKAKSFLTSTQQEDGSWQVKTKLKPNKGKEHGSQISSFFGSAWAVIALSRISTDTPEAQASR